MVRKTQRLKRKSRRVKRKSSRRVSRRVKRKSSRRVSRRVKRKSRRVSRRVKRKVKRKSRRVSRKGKRQMGGDGQLWTEDKQSILYTMEKCEDKSASLWSTCHEHNDGAQLFKINIGIISPYIFRFDALETVFGEVAAETFKGTDEASFLDKISYKTGVKYIMKTNRPPQAFENFLTKVAAASDMKNFIEKLKQANNRTLQSLKSYMELTEIQRGSLEKENYAKIYELSVQQSYEEGLRMMSAMRLAGYAVPELYDPNIQMGPSDSRTSLKGPDKGSESELEKWAESRASAAPPVKVEEARAAGPGISQIFSIKIGGVKPLEFMTTFTGLEKLKELYTCKPEQVEDNFYCKLNERYWATFRDDKIGSGHDQSLSVLGVFKVPIVKKDERKASNLKKYIMSLFYLSLKDLLPGFEFTNIKAELTRIDSIYRPTLPLSSKQQVPYELYGELG